MAIRVTAPLRLRMARVSTYLNFPGNTEEAFIFYRGVFETEFTGPIARFHEVPAEPGQPTLPETMANLILHIELPILGGHILMGTDAPESMGFTLRPGNVMHINLEPDSFDEAKHLYDALSAGGTVETPLQEMFWGAMFASFTDRFGIRWMLNCRK